MDIAKRVGNSEIAEFIINHEPLPKGDEHYMYSNQDTNHDAIRCALYVLGSLGMVCMGSQTFQNACPSTRCMCLYYHIIL